MPFDLRARVLRHEPENPDHFLLTLEAPPIARAARPGQFVMLRVRDGLDPLLRRPMSIFRVPPGGRSIEILYKVVGAGTAQLARQPAGASLATLGPLGNGFTLPEPLPRRRPARGRREDVPRVLFVAGGIGIAIFPFVAEALRRIGHRPTLLFGARARRDLVGLGFFRRAGIPCRIATEDGSAGSRGLVTRLLEPLLREAPRAGRPLLYVCGPTPMMRAVAGLALEAGADCQLALESQMPCGIGVCLGCVVRCTTDGSQPAYRRVCTEGPVFRAHEVAW